MDFEEWFNIRLPKIEKTRISRESGGFGLL
jgi:hypothetical protein